MDSLPDEILHKIFAELEDQMPLDKWELYGARLDHRGSAALGNLCLVSRQFRRIAQPLLYRTIVIEGRRRAKNIGTLLLRTFVENPQLAEQVRAVSLTDCVKFSEQVVDCTIGDRTKILPWLLSASPDAGRPLGWLRRTKKGEYGFSDKDPYVVDYGKELSMEEYQQKGSSKGTFTNYRFANLAEIRLRAVESPKAIELPWDIEPLLLNSRLKTLRTLGIAWYGDELTRFVWPEHKNFNVEYFDLVESYVDAEGLETILTRCPKLKGISIRLPDEERQLIVNDDEGYDEEQECILNFDEFGDVIRKHGQNLQDFDLYTFFFESYSTTYRGRGPGEGMIGSLRELKYLKHLGVLPESIETLHLYCSGIWKTEDWVGSERELYNQGVYNLLLDRMPNLREIRIERCKTGFDSSFHFETYSELDLDLGLVDAVDAAADDDDASHFSGNDPEGLYKPQFGPEEFMYSKEAEWPPELHVAGWTANIVDTSLYKREKRDLG
ncbi:hypothetical protein FNAPI_13403 [Fusarium napiforme]|uniref:F-box domain-containing protein n=1 Tax=Fusarium napiforme TaxID=42672 RepID=A0A8H5MJA5_9HYPO|nr:hypothetical protein FNAPI_13403 [Fusarium napiforme]